jgi:hypothetical protein
MIQYAFYDKDMCDRQFALDHLEWLLLAKFNSLELIVRSLLIVQNSTKGKRD